MNIKETYDYDIFYKNYVVYSEDNSFDYGDRTHYQYYHHGFEIPYNDDDEIIFNKIKGFGDYSDIKIHNYNELYNFLTNIKYIGEDMAEGYDKENNEIRFDELICEIKNKIESEENYVYKQRETLR